MTLKRFILATSIALAAVVGMNLLIHRLAANAPARVLLRGINQQTNIDVLLLGNSLMAAGGDTAAFAKSWSNRDSVSDVCNASLGWSSPVEHLIIAQRAMSAHPHIRCVVYGFFDFQLTDPPQANFADLSGNRAMALYADAELAAAMYAPGSALAKWQFRAAGAVPMVTDRGTIWQKVEIIRRRFGGIGMPAQHRSEFGRVGDFRALEAPSVAAFERSCTDAVKSPAPFCRPIDELIRSTTNATAKLFFVEMPMPPEHRRVFYSTVAWANYRAHLIQLASAQGVGYVNASDWFPAASAFADELHVSRETAAVFSARLAAEIAKSIAAEPSK